MTRFRWGIFGTGAISAKFVAGLASARNAEVVFVASRSLERAQRFANGMKIGRAIEGYARAAKMGGVDAVYIATPPSEHAEHALLCLDAGLAILVEKPLAFTSVDASRIANAARAKSLFAMEALWTRFLPAATALRETLAASAIGEVRMVSGSFGTSQAVLSNNGIFDPVLGGGALAHLGVYPLSLAQWLLGTPTLVQALGSIGRTGVDEDAAFQLCYPGGVLGSFFVSIRTWAPDDFNVMGTHGAAAFRGSIVRPQGLSIAHDAPRHAEPTSYDWRARLRQHPLIHGLAQRTGRSSRSRNKTSNYFYTGNGYHYEADEVSSCIARGAIESDVMPLRDSLEVAETIDLIRSELRQPSATALR